MYFSNCRRCMPLLRLLYFDVQLGNDPFVDAAVLVARRPFRQV